MHIMDGVPDNNRFPYTADEGLYEGGGTLSTDLFEGYRKGPVDGTFRMWRIKWAIHDIAPVKEWSDGSPGQGLSDL